MPKRVNASRCAWTMAPRSISCSSTQRCSTSPRACAIPPCRAPAGCAMPWHCWKRSPAAKRSRISSPCPPTSASSTHFPAPARAVKARSRQRFLEMDMTTRQQQLAALDRDWTTNPRWNGIERPYAAADVVRLRGSVQPEHTLARRGADRLWQLVNGSARKGYVNAFGAISGGQAMQQAKAGLEAVYLSGWQVAADGNTSETMYPDQSLYAYD